MIINLLMPQSVVWACPQLDDTDRTSESHPSSNLQKEISQALCRQLFGNCSIQVVTLCDGLLSQVQPSQPLGIMDDQLWPQPMAIDSGDEVQIKGEDFYSDNLSRTDGSSPYARAQTVASGVSAVNPGGDYGPSQCQHKELTGNEQMFSQTLPTANAYTRSFGDSYDPRHYSWQSYNTIGNNQAANYLDFTDGLETNNCHSNLSVFGEPLEGPHVSSSSFSSSVPSGMDMDMAMDTMSFDSVPTHVDTASTSNSIHQVNSSVAAIGTPDNTWDASCPSTISPKMLRINPSPTPTSSSESTRTKERTNNDADLGSPTVEHRTLEHRRHSSARPRSPRPRSPLSPQRTKPKPRRELPKKPEKLVDRRPRLLMGSSKSRPVKEKVKDKSSKNKRKSSASHQPASPHTPPRELSVDPTPSYHEFRVDQLKVERKDDMSQAADEPLYPESTVAESAVAESAVAESTIVENTIVEATPAEETINLGENRAAKDEFLLKSKMAGMTYKEIRRKGNFTEAESTLRGRFRTLTKEKEARVRKPEWQDDDIRLLTRAVRKLIKGSSPAKAPWGQVATYIADHGGSYHFGSATCHRKWKELKEEGLA